MSEITNLVYLPLFAILLTAVLTDLHSRRVPNKLVVAGFVISLLQFLSPYSIAPLWWQPFAGAAIAGGLLIPLYAMRAMGAGDVKLMSVVGAFVGPATAVWVVLWTLVAGGLLSLLVLLVKRERNEVFVNLGVMLFELQTRGRGVIPTLGPLQKTAFRLPYAVAIAVGTVVALLAKFPT